MSERNEISMVFEDPPAEVLARPTGHRSKWTERAEALKARPDEWAKFGPFASASPDSGVRKALTSKGGGAKFTVIKHDDGEARWVYVKCHGTPKPNPNRIPRPADKVDEPAPKPAKQSTATTKTERRLGVNEHTCSCGEAFDTRGALARHRRAEDHYDDEVAE